eukprot:m.118944 g.118944  ORF g.118944 m.118944 type:complete len:50 (+) comp13668_c0_seq10:1021-1170(+)
MACDTHTSALACILASHMGEHLHKHLSLTSSLTAFLGVMNRQWDGRFAI